MGEDGLRERIDRIVDATDNDDLRYHLRSALQHLDVEGELSERDHRR